MERRLALVDGWVVIPNWEKWQSRRDRHDPWIKHHVDQLDRVEYLSLTLAERGLLADIRAAYSRHNGHLRAEHVPGIVQAKVYTNQWKRLVDAGYIDISAAKPPPIRGQSAARAREEVRSRERTPKPPSRENGNPPPEQAERRARTWIANGLAGEVPPERLGDVLADEFGITDAALIDGLVQLARGEET